MKSLDNNNFEETIAQDKLTFVDFWAEWCGPCRMLMPIVEEISSEIGDKANICKVNVDEAPEVASKFNIRSIPTMILFKNGKPVETVVGAKSKAEILDLINSNI